MSDCTIFAIPNICYGVSRSAALSIGRMCVRVSGYEQNSDVFDTFGFTPADVTTAWNPELDDLDGSTSEDGSAVCDQNANVTTPNVKIVNWYACALSKLSSAGTKMPAVPEGGCSNGELIYKNSATKGVVSPSTVGKNIAMSASPQSLTASTPGGDTPTTECNIFIGVVTNAPSAGFGTGTVKKAVFHSDGTYSTTGNNISVVFPYI